MMTKNEHQQSGKDSKTYTLAQNVYQSCCETKYLHFLMRVPPVLLSVSVCVGWCMFAQPGPSPPLIFGPHGLTSSGRIIQSPFLSFCVDLVNERLGGQKMSRKQGWGIFAPGSFFIGVQFSGFCIPLPKARAPVKCPGPVAMTLTRLASEKTSPFCFFELKRGNDFYCCQSEAPSPSLQLPSILSILL